MLTWFQTELHRMQRRGGPKWTNVRDVVVGCLAVVAIITVVAFFLSLVAFIFLWPFALFWALNTLAGMTIEYSFINWLAAIVIMMVLRMATNGSK